MEIITFGGVIDNNRRICLQTVVKIMTCIDEIKEIDFDLWKWIISGGYFTEIKEIVITSRDPVEGFFTFRKCWHPIKTEETLDQWLDNNFDKIRRCYVFEST